MGNAGCFSCEWNIGSTWEAYQRVAKGRTVTDGSQSSSSIQFSNNSPYLLSKAQFKGERAISTLVRVHWC